MATAKIATVPGSRAFFVSEAEPSTRNLVSPLYFAGVRLDVEPHGRHLVHHGECVVQGEDLSLGHDTRGRASDKAPGKQDGDKDQQMGSALRSVYQKTVEEAVPDEMLALLGKLD
jgi:hypothetical protein